MDETIILCRPDGHLPSGKHTHRFKVRLPPFAPASFDGQFGRVQYWAKVVIERPFGKDNIEAVKAFNVKGILDLNADPDAKKAAENAGETTPGLFCFKSGRISASLSVDRRSTAPGLSVPFTAIIKNESGARVKSARIILSQQVIYKADKQTRRHSTPLKGVSRNKEIGAGTESWVGEITDIPPVVPSHLGAGCKFIDVRYILTLIVVPKGPGKELEVPLEIVIGTVPVRRPSSVGPQLTVRGAIARASAGHLDVNDLREAVFRADKPKN
ncbi:DgyrCDS8167 [Dimorphilus gyrociliatus]|nr:DgyrCDS8167 [Dimorphilus gyrociliatus]